MTDNTICCPRCYCDNIPDEAIYCRNCGLELHGNYCSNTSCELNDRDEPLPFPHDYCFCEICGSKTIFYEQGIIQPHDFISK